MCSVVLVRETEAQRLNGRRKIVSVVGSEQKEGSEDRPGVGLGKT